MSKTGKAVLIFTSITALMGIAMYIIYKQSIKSTSSTANSTNAYMKSLANVFSGISSAIGNPSSDIPASAWAGGSNSPSYNYPSISPQTGYSIDSGVDYFDTGIGSSDYVDSNSPYTPSYEDTSDNSDNSASINTSEA
jgi:hypothetical protein